VGHAASPLFAPCERCNHSIIPKNRRTYNIKRGVSAILMLQPEFTASFLLAAKNAKEREENCTETSLNKKFLEV
jgi:hypothetical protein